MSLKNLANILRKSHRYNGRVLVIVGPTGSGKTGVVIEIAKKIGGEIISADSRAIYKGMDIGTAKPSLEEQGNVSHFGLDLVEPGERFTVVDWKEYAEQKIEEIRNRGHVPIVAGGTGLYVDSLLFDYKFTDDVKNNCSDRKNSCANFLIIGVKIDKKILRERLVRRVDMMFNQGLYDETKRLVKKYGWNSQAMKSNIYQFVWKYLQGSLSVEEAKIAAEIDDWHLAKRQITWFKRNKNIVWLPLEEIEKYVLECI